MNVVGLLGLYDEVLFWIVMGVMGGFGVVIVVFLKWMKIF